jgi:hypothetical protein
VKPHTRASFPVLFAIVVACAGLLIAGSLLARPGASDSKTAPKFSASSIQIQPLDTGDVPIPPDFRVAIYENLIEQVRKTGKFQRVYRSGEKAAASVPDLVTLRTTAESFKEGSQKKREVTTIAGSTSIKLRVQITDHAGQTLVDREVEGRVRFFGENLRATYDYAKKVATIIRDNF